MFVKSVTTVSTTITDSVYNEYIKKFSDLLEEKLKVEEGFNHVPLPKYEEILRVNNPFYKMAQDLRKQDKHVTNAYIKLRESLVEMEKYNFVFNNCFHMAEFPGSFIICMEKYCKQKNLPYNWNANSYMRSANTESLYLDDYFQLYKNNPTKWIFGAFGDGDITRLDNIRSIIQDLSRISPSISFITGDAKVVNVNPHTKEVNWSTEEEDNVIVLYSETILALSLLAMKGSAIIKFFTFFKPETIYVLYNISKYFETTLITKPVTSRPANSEVYLICINKNKEFNTDFLFYAGMRSDTDNSIKTGSGNNDDTCTSNTISLNTESPFIQLPRNIKVPDDFIKKLYDIVHELFESQMVALKTNLSLKVIPYEKSIIDDWLNKYWL